MDKLLNNRKYIILFLCICLLIVCGFYYIFVGNNNSQDIVIAEEFEEQTTTKEVINDNIFVDVKGAVKKPGVYELTTHDKVVDAINKAGGLTSSAVTKNINLSKKLTNEMVIYVFTKKELTTTSVSIKNDNECKCEVVEINNCIQKEEEKNNELNNKININTAAKEQLIILDGIGDAKADAIIKYRDDNGLFKSIEDILNISGISKTIYEKIKDNITI